MALIRTLPSTAFPPNVALPATLDDSPPRRTPLIPITTKQLRKLSKAEGDSPGLYTLIRQSLKDVVEQTRPNICEDEKSCKEAKRTWDPTFIRALVDGMQIYANATCEGLSIDASTYRKLIFLCIYCKEGFHHPQCLSFEYDRGRVSISVAETWEQRQKCIVYVQSILDRYNPPNTSALYHKAQHTIKYLKAVDADSSSS